MPLTYPDVVTLDQAKAWLRVDDDNEDALLAQVISAASAMWQRRVGPVSASCDEWYNGGGSQIVLRHTPVLAVTSVSESFGPIYYDLALADLSNPSTLGTPWSYTVDLDAGILTRRASGVAGRFAPGVRNVHVVYTAGYTSTPADVLEGVLLLVSHLWEMQRANPTGAGGLGQEFAQPVPNFAWPRRAEEIATALQKPGIA